MSKSKGIQGEDQAEDYLLGKGFEILERNFRHGRAEIDLIVLWQNELLVFVEVKLRSRKDFGEPESFVSDHQQMKIKDAAEEYVFGINWKKDIRFDIITVDKSGEIAHFEDAFY